MAIVAFFDLKPCFCEFEFVDNSSSTMSMLCNRMFTTDSCRRNNFGRKLIFFPRSKKATHQMGSLYLIKSVANTIFVVLDSTCADKMSQGVDEIHTHDGGSIPAYKYSGKTRFGINYPK